MGRKAPPAASAQARTNASVAASRRSRTGCLTCRKRKLKCDERKPTCLNCEKGNRECEPPDTLIFRNHHNPSINQDTAEGSGGLDSYYAYKQTFAPDTVWLPIPAVLTFINITNPFVEDEEAGSQSAAAPGYQQMATHTLEALSTAATQDNPQFNTFSATLYADSSTMYSFVGTYSNTSPYAANIDPNLERAGKAKGEDVATLLRRFSEE